MSTPTLPPIATQAASEPKSTVPPPLPLPDGNEPSSKALVVGVGALLIAVVIIFFIRQGFVNWLVGSLKRSPNSASLAGWGLFGTLFFGAVIGALAIISPALLGLVYLVPLGGFALICLIICIVGATRR